MSARAASTAGPAKRNAFACRPSSSTRASQLSFASKKRSTSDRIGFGSVAYSAASMPQRHMRFCASTDA